jgi:SHS2 domain-containing protein
MVSGGYAAFSHTGDVGLEIRAESPAELFAIAGRALTEQMALPTETGDVVRERLDLEADGWEDLFVHWLNTLLLRSELAQAWWTTFEIETLSPRRLVAEVAGPRRGPQHERMREVKAASHHALALEIAPGRCVARVVLDL